eukprot:8965736-Alexandrium_andersonii.AAC.1
MAPGCATLRRLGAHPGRARAGRPEGLPREASEPPAAMALRLRLGRGVRRGEPGRHLRRLAALR